MGNMVHSVTGDMCVCVCERPSMCVCDVCDVCR